MKTAAGDTADSGGADMDKTQGPIISGASGISGEERISEREGTKPGTASKRTDERPEGPDRIYGRRARARLIVDSTSEDEKPSPTRKIRNPAWKKNRV